MHVDTFAKNVAHSFLRIAKEKGLTEVSLNEEFRLGKWKHIDDRLMELKTLYEEAILDALGLLEKDTDQGDQA